MDVVTVRPTGLGPCDLLTAEELARYLRVGEPRAVAWAAERGLRCDDAPGAARYIVGDVIAALRRGPAPAEEPPPPPRRRGSVNAPRARL